MTRSPAHGAARQRGPLLHSVRTMDDSRQLKEIIRRALIMILNALEDDLKIERSIQRKKRGEHADY